MLKFLLIALVVLLLVGVLGYLRLHQSSSSKPSIGLINQLASTSQESASSSSSPAEVSDRLKTLELAVGALIQKVNKLDNSSPQSTADLESRIKKLETAVADLQSRTGTYTPQAVQSSTSTQSAPLYIPLATTGNSGDRNMVPLPGSSISVDPGNYSGYKNVQLEVNMNLSESAGVANAVLYDVGAKAAVSGSQVSTTSSQPVYLTSGTFNLPAGQKTYALGVQSTQGYTIYVYSARLKVNY